MSTITTTVTLVATLTVGAGLGGFVGHNLTTRAEVTCPAPAEAKRSQAEADFFKENQNFPITGGHRY